MQLECFCRFSLSPRGDGNKSASGMLKWCKKIFFIPARGRKQINAVTCASIHDDFLYPREGTETMLIFILFSSYPDFLYPREGTETKVGQLIDNDVYRFSLSPRGDGNLYSMISQ